MPLPTSHPLEHAFGSPVPAQSVLWSFGSSSSAETFWASSPPEMYSHTGPSLAGVAGSSVASALSVRQIPPFDAPIQSVHVAGAGLQSGDITPAVVRPPKFSVPAV